MSDGSRKSGSGTNLSRIQKVDASPQGGVEGAAWVTAVKILNPIGAAAEAYAKTLAYRVEMKRLEVEAERVRKEAGIVEAAIEATYQLKMEELAHRRIAIQRAFDTIQQELRQLHLQRMAVLEMAQNASRAALSSDLTMEERQLAKEMTTDLTATLPQFGVEASKNLETLVRALPTVEVAKHLLPSSE